MLVAKTDHNRLVSLASGFTEAELRRLQKTGDFYCPACNESVMLRVGIKRCSHFAHRKKECTVDQEGESDYHVTGKLQLFRWLKTHTSAQLEHYLPQLQQRPDLFVEVGKTAYALEFQCASLSTEAFVQRTNGYKSQGYYPFWVMGAKRLKRLGASLFRLSPQEWQYLTISEQSPTLYYFSPFTNELIKLEHIIPFSSQIAFAELKIFTPNSHTFSEWLTLHTSPSYHEGWIQKKRNFRTTYMLYPGLQHKHFLEKLYTLQIPPTHFPSEAGFPIPSAFMLETPAVIWQAWLLLDIMHVKKVGEIVNLKQIYMQFSARIRQKLIKVRSVPFMHSTIEKPLLEYVEVLCKLGLLSPVTHDSYRIERGYTVPLLSSDAFLEDGLLMKKWLDQAKEVTR
ncbi:competence protein CoiA [Priestia sp. GS2]|uniref:competence protein CoiA n=1 Tax=Priestia sp. GS2 TaxID=3117403 RepID=UPI002ED9EE2D